MLGTIHQIWKFTFTLGCLCFQTSRRFPRVDQLAEQTSRQPDNSVSSSWNTTGVQNIFQKIQLLTRQRQHFYSIYLLNKCKQSTSVGQRGDCRDCRAEKHTHSLNEAQTGELHTSWSNRKKSAVATKTVLTWEFMEPQVVVRGTAPPPISRCKRTCDLMYQVPLLISGHIFKKKGVGG